jgi:hypothetical protein
VDGSSDAQWKDTSKIFLTIWALVIEGSSLAFFHSRTCHRFEDQGAMQPRKTNERQGHEEHKEMHTKCTKGDRDIVAFLWISI